MSLERRGVPTATFITQAFSQYARNLTRMQGMEALPVLIIPHPVAARPREALDAMVRHVATELGVALTGESGKS